LDSHDVCVGCFRTREEIARWIQMADDEKSLVLAALKDRQIAGNPGRSSVAATGSSS
jgi:predicted Fe-S protein YdhL (DUF1289 family)